MKNFSRIIIGLNGADVWVTAALPSGGGDSGYWLAALVTGPRIRQ